MPAVIPPLWPIDITLFGPALIWGLSFSGAIGVSFALGLAAGGDGAAGGLMGSLLDGCASARSARGSESTCFHASPVARAASKPLAMTDGQNGRRIVVTHHNTTAATP